jgi:energy-coupling factor transporter transmembrane protein EcfT
VNHTPSKPWYKHWWGIILAVLILPIFLIWLIWARAHWQTIGRIVATAGIIFLVLWFCSELRLLQITHALSRDSRNVTIQSPAYTLAAYDLGHTPDASTVSRYQKALDDLGPHNGLGAYCPESQEKLAGEVHTSLQHLRENGITDQTNLTLIGHIKDSVPIIIKRPNQPQDLQIHSMCLGVLSAYLWSREPLIHR